MESKKYKNDSKKYSHFDPSCIGPHGVYNLGYHLQFQQFSKCETETNCSDLLFTQIFSFPNLGLSSSIIIFYTDCLRLVHQFTNKLHAAKNNGASTAPPPAAPSSDRSKRNKRKTNTNFLDQPFINETNHQCLLKN